MVRGLQFALVRQHERTAFTAVRRNPAASYTSASAVRALPQGGGARLRACRLEAAHKPHFWGSAEGGGTPYHCLGVAQVFFYRDWERQVRRFHPPGPDQVQAARRLLDALDRWEEMPDTAGSRWAVKFLRWLAEYESPPQEGDR